MNPLYDEYELKSSYFENFSDYPTLNPQSLPLDDMIMSNIGTESLEDETLKTEYKSSCYSKQMMISTSNASTSDATNFIAFGYPNSPPVEQHRFYASLDLPKKSKNELVPQEIFSFSHKMSQVSYNQNHASEFGKEIKRIDSTINRSSLQAREHVIAERLRREKLSKLFIGLSAQIPGLKKLDKASILKDAVEYIKQLQEREKVLEEEACRQSEESTVTKTKTLMLSKDDDDAHRSSSVPLLSDVRARVCDQNVLIRIHCQRPKGIILKVLNELEKLHLTIINCRVIPFDNNLDITITAQIDVKFCITTNELVEEVRSAFSKLV